MDALMHATWAGLVQAMSWPTAGYLIAGIAVGFVIGLIPGLSGVTGMAMLLPLVYDKSPADALALLIGMYAVTTLSDTIPAVLIGIPGTSSAQAGILDGYPMAKRGEAARALGAAYTCDVLATVLGLLVFIASYPFLKPLVLAFAAPELFMLGILGISLVGFLSSGSTRLRGAIVAGFGLMLAMIGLAPQAGFPRYTFGLLYLWERLPLVPVVLGLFGIPELVDLVVRRQAISAVPLRADRGMWQGVLDCLQNWALMLRAGLLGAVAGVIPALGGPVAEWWGYAHAVQSARDKSQFGKGDVRGVIGSEAAVAHEKPTALIPTLAFGIPGNLPMAILLGGFLILGVRPGEAMLTTQLPLTMTIMWTMVIANVVAAVVAIALSNVLARITMLRASILVPVVLVFMAVAAVVSTSTIADVVVMCAFGVLGFVMERTGWPRAPMVLGLVLGSMIETYLFIAVDAYGWSWLGRPMVVALLLATVLPYLLPSLARLRAARRGVPA